jgi:hypothetical protein
MQVYILYAPEDSAFAKKLANDLDEEGIRPILAEKDTDEQFAELQKSQAVLVALSTYAVQDARVLSTIDVIQNIDIPVIALRIGSVNEIPQSLKGILPLDFTEEGAYEDSFATLLEDLNPPEPSEPILPESIRIALASDDTADRKQGIEMLGKLRSEFDGNVRTLAEQVLRDLVFKDPEASVKSMARTTLQLFNQGAASEEIMLAKTTPALPNLPAAERQRVSELNTTKSNPAPQAMIDQTPRSVVPIWYAQQWWVLPIVGVVLALLQAILVAEETQDIIAIVLPIGLSALLLPWLNIVIRDGGNLAWEMPGPLIGNGVAAGILGIIGLGIGAVVGNNLETKDVIALLSITTIYGISIGWISSLYARQ